MPTANTNKQRNIFVFGSNLAGRHGAGAAKFAVDKHGAKYGQGIGLQGNSYGIPTKDENIETLPLHKVQEHVTVFIRFAEEHPELTFNVTRIGCGLAGYDDLDIAPLFAPGNVFNAPANCILPEGWRTIGPRVKALHAQVRILTAELESTGARRLDLIIAQEEARSAKEELQRAVDTEPWEYYGCYDDQRCFFCGNGRNERQNGDYECFHAQECVWWLHSPKSEREVEDEDVQGQ